MDLSVSLQFAFQLFPRIVVFVLTVCNNVIVFVGMYNRVLMSCSVMCMCKRMSVRVRVILEKRIDDRQNGTDNHHGKSHKV